MLHDPTRAVCATGALRKSTRGRVTSLVVPPSGGATPSAPPVSTETRTVFERIPLEKLHPHKSNRRITHDDVADLVESMREHGQREPIRVRPLDDPIGHYEILSGGRRYAAALKLDLDGLNCIVERAGTTPTGLIELAIANAHRQDLDAIQRAELLTKLIAPTADGGAGMDRAAAGRIFGLNADSSIRNALRLFELPECWRDLVRQRRLPESLARYLVTYPSMLLIAFHGDVLRGSDERIDMLIAEMAADVSRSIVPHELRIWIHSHSRPVDKREHYSGYQLGKAPCLFAIESLPQSQREDLRICEIPDEFKKNTTCKISLNVKLWDKLQTPLLKAKAAEDRKSPKDKNRGTAKSNPPNPAQLKARAKAADDQIDKFTARWIRLGYRATIAEDTTGEDELMWRLLPWLLTRLEYNAPRIDSYLSWALCESQRFERDRRHGIWTAHDVLQLVPRDEYPRLLYLRLWRLILWPVSQHDLADAELHHPDLASGGTLPDVVPPIANSDVDELAGLMHVDAAEIWKRAATHDSTQRALVGQWLCRHTKAQLAQLAKELGITDLPSGTRDQQVEHLLDLHKAGKRLPLPSRISRSISPKLTIRNPKPRKARS